MRAWCLLTILLTTPLWCSAAEPPAHAPETYAFTVAKVRDCTDGDTCRLDLDDAHPVFGKVTWKNQAVRLAGVDTPELHPARCDAERMLGEKAKARTLELLNGAAAVTLTVNAKHPREKYGRLLGTLHVDGKDLGEILVAEGLAHIYAGRGRRKGWCS